MIITPPILEDDYFRYLWDGAVTANGLSPYTYSPKEVMNNENIPPQLHKLASDSGDIFTHINHPTLRTIYPPLTQAVFAFSYKLGPWSVITWKLILLLFGAATLWLLYLAIRMLKLPDAYLLIYWWNPLLVKEIYNSGHLDILVFPLVVGGLLLAIRSSYIKSMVSLVLGIGVKLWPVFLLPLIIRPLLSKPKRLIVVLLLIGALLTVMFTPVYLSGVNHSSGFIAYGQSWQNNDSIFRGFIYISSFSLELLGYETFHKYITARFSAALVFGIWILYVSYRKPENGRDLFRKGLMVMAFAFLISPTQFPWYYTWLLPFLTVIPRYSLLMLTALLPLYYLRYYFEPRGELYIFTNYIVWIEFVPVWLLLIWEWRRNKIPGAD